MSDAARHPVHAIRFFMPHVELDLCGHATLAAAHAVLNHLEVGAYCGMGEGCPGAGTGDMAEFRTPLGDMLMVQRKMHNGKEEVYRLAN